MEKLKLALEKLSSSIRDLENSVDYCVNQQNLHKEKIETLQTAIQTTYSRIDLALKKLDEKKNISQETE